VLQRVIDHTISRYHSTYKWCATQILCKRAWLCAASFVF